MPLGARRTFRLALVVALALAGGYGLGIQLPFIGPVFAVLLTATPAPPLGVKGLFGLVLVVVVTLGVGLLLIPILLNYPVSGVLIIAVGLYLSTIVSVELGQNLVGTLLTIGFTLIPAMGLVDYGLAIDVIEALLGGIALAVVCQGIVYPWFPEDQAPATPAVPRGGAVSRSGWTALRATLIVLPPVWMALSNPALYMPVIMKSVLLAQQGSVVGARTAGRELLGSTFVAGWFAILFWFALKIHPTLWMFSLWMLLFGIYFAGKLYGITATRFTPSFWVNVVVTMLILLGSAVQDSAGGKDVYQAFAVRMSLFVAVTLYAWTAIVALGRLRASRLVKPPSFAAATPR